MADLDEISMVLGEIRSDIKHMRNDFNQVIVWQELHEKKDQERFEQIAERIHVNNGYRFRIEALEDTVETHAPVIEGVKRFRWIAAGAVAAIGILSSQFSSWASNVMKWFA